MNVGPYKLGTVLGIGTYGEVRVATHTETGRRVALKMVDLSRFPPDTAALVQKEITILEQTNDKHCIELIEVKENVPKHGTWCDLCACSLLVVDEIHELYVSSSPFNDDRNELPMNCKVCGHDMGDHSLPETRRVLLIIEELAVGGELFNIINATGPLPEELARHYFRQLIDGLSYIHSQNIVHRDLKPENLVLDHKCNLKMIDFGLAAFNGPRSKIDIPSTPPTLSSFHLQPSQQSIPCSSPCSSVSCANPRSPIHVSFYKTSQVIHSPLGSFTTTGLKEEAKFLYLSHNDDTCSEIQSKLCADANMSGDTDLIKETDEEEVDSSTSWATASIHFESPAEGTSPSPKGVQLTNTNVSQKAKETSSTCDNTNEVKGSVLHSGVGSQPYSAPEVYYTHELYQSRGYCGRAADVWSAGVILYVLLKGRPPFLRPLDKTYSSKLRRCKHFIDFQQGNGFDNISDDAKELVMNMLNVDPDQRIAISEIKKSKWYSGPIPSIADVRNKMLVRILETWDTLGKHELVHLFSGLTEDDPSLISG